MRSALTLARELPATASAPVLPVMANPAVEELQVAPYWGPEYRTDKNKTTLASH